MLQDKNLWIFDLDDTLYHPSHGVLDHLKKHGRAQIADMMGMSLEDFNVLASKYVEKYGAPFRGLHLHHDDLDMDALIERVFSNLPIDAISFDENSKKSLENLPGKKVVFSNSPMLHVERLLTKMNLQNSFDAVFDVTQVDFMTKPQVETYHHVLTQMNTPAKNAVMVEDMAKNLKPAHGLGMSTVLVHQEEANDAAFVDYQFETIQAFLKAVHGKLT